MDELIKKLVGEVPQIGALIVLVWMFLKNIEKRDVFIRQLHDEHMEARRSSQLSITENTRAMETLTEVIKQRNE